MSSIFTQNCHVCYNTGLSDFLTTISIHGMVSEPSVDGIATLRLNRSVLWFEKPIQFSCFVPKYFIL